MLFDKTIYIARRNRLKSQIKSGLILLFGNNDSPANYPANVYPYRQDSSFLYFFGLHRNGLVGVIDIDNDKEYLVGNDIDIEDIVWFGSVDSVADMAQQCGVAESKPLSQLRNMVEQAKACGQTIHFLPPYRHDIMIQIMDLLGIHPSEQREKASLELIKAVIDQRAVKSAEEIAEIERACAIGYEMHTTAMQLCKPGVTEQYIAGTISGIAAAKGCMVSFPTILSMHGEIMHGVPYPRPLEAGRLMLCDAGAETNENYCSDNTRTTPISGKFTTRQREIYQIVEACHDYAIEIARPGIKWWDVHMGVARLMTEQLKALGLMKGDTDEAVRAGAHALFFPHGLGHMMGLDVHDMENLGEIWVGYNGQPKSTQFGRKSQRLAIPLEPGFVHTVEPGIYFIPELIDMWRAEKKFTDFINYDKVETYKDFGGIRNEEDYLITETGARRLGKKIPLTPEEVEALR